MGYLIKVNHCELASAAKLVEDYINVSKKKMKTMSNSVDSLKNVAWVGTDYDQLANKWDGVNNKGSVYYNFTENLAAYADYLNFSAEQYKKAQSRAINKANFLPQW